MDMGALTEGNNPGVTDVLQDDGSYLRAAYTWDRDNPDDKYFALTLFPFSTERFRLGYLYDISWGGGNIFTNNRSGLAPGLKFDVHAKMKHVVADAFVGFKTARIKQGCPGRKPGSRADFRQGNQLRRAWRRRG